MLGARSWWLLLTVTFCWGAESLPLAFSISVSHIVPNVASNRPFVLQTFPLALQSWPKLWCEKKWNWWEGAAAVEICRARANFAQLSLCCVWMAKKRNAVWVWKNRFGHLLLNIKVYLNILISSLKGRRKPVFCFVCIEQTDAIWKTWEKGNEMLWFLP